MKNAEAKALEWFFKNKSNVLISPERILLSRVSPGAFLNFFKDKAVICWQTYYPDMLALREVGMTVELHPEGSFDLVLYMGTKYKEENLYMFARGLSYLNPEGVFLCCMANNIGASRFERHLGTLSGNIASISKSKCRVFWAKKNSGMDTSLHEEWLRKGNLSQIKDSELWGYPGISCWNKIDAGSKMLTEHLPKDLRGIGADIRAGYGYLSHYLLTQPTNKIKALHLYDAEHLALEAAKHNLQQVDADVNLEFYWHDTNLGLHQKNYDWIIMNAPFFQRKGLSIELEQPLIGIAAASLRTGGELYMVANRQLPYEKALQTSFRHVDKRIEENGYKIFFAKK